MKLTELEPKYISYVVEDGQEIHRYVDSLDEADGIIFLCPKCFIKNGGPIGTHSVICWKPIVPQTITPKPGRWNIVGTGFSDLSLVAGSSSVALQGGCSAHFFIQNGEIKNV